MLPALLNPLRKGLAQVSADGAYDTRARHSPLQRKGCKATIPPRNNAGLWVDNHPRNKAVIALKEGKLAQWKQENDYHLRSLSEAAIY